MTELSYSVSCQMHNYYKYKKEQPCPTGAQLFFKVIILNTKEPGSSQLSRIIIIINTYKKRYPVLLCLSLVIFLIIILRTSGQYLPGISTCIIINTFKERHGPTLKNEAELFFLF